MSAGLAANRGPMQNKLCQKPVGIIENYGQPRQEWRGQKREERDRENEEGNRNDQQVREQ